MCLEDAFWKGVKEVQASEAIFSSALRLFVLDFYRSQIPEVEDREGLREMLERPKPLLT